MNRIFTKYGIAILSVAALIAVMLAGMAFFSSSSAMAPNLLGTIATPLRTIGTVITNTIDGWVSYFTEYDALKEENAALRKELSELEAEVRQAEFFREENERLRDLVGLREQRRDLTLESALVIERDVSNWNSLLTINKGTLYDIEVGDCVINEEGFLVGVIAQAGLNWATVRTVLDSETELGATVFRNSLNAIAQGDFALMSEGRLSLGYLSSDSDVVAGDLIVTSGLGEYLPSQLVIGYVESLRTTDDGLSRSAVVCPEANVAELTQVFVVTDFVIVD